MTSQLRREAAIVIACSDDHPRAEVPQNTPPPTLGGEPYLIPRRGWWHCAPTSKPVPATPTAATATNSENVTRRMFSRYSAMPPWCTSEIRDRCGLGETTPTYGPERGSGDHRSARNASTLSVSNAADPAS